MTSGVGLSEQELFSRVLENFGGCSGGGGSGASGSPPSRVARKHRLFEIEDECEGVVRKRPMLGFEESGGLFVSPSSELEGMSFDQTKSELLKLSKAVYEVAVDRLFQIVSMSNQNGYSIGKALIALSKSCVKLKEVIETYIADVGLLEEVLKKKIRLCEIPPEKCTETLCLAAVQVDPLAFRTHLISRKIRNVCKYMVIRRGVNLNYVDESLRDKEICYLALDESHSAFMYFPEILKTKELCDLVLTKNVKLFKFIPLEFRTYEFCLEMAKRDGGILADVPTKFRNEEMYLAAVGSNPNCLRIIPMKYRTYEICYRAVQNPNPRIHVCRNFFIDIPQKYRTVEMYVKFVTRFPNFTPQIFPSEEPFELVQEIFRLDRSSFLHLDLPLKNLISSNLQLLAVVPDRYKSKFFTIRTLEEISRELTTYVKISKEGESVESLFTTLKEHIEFTFSRLEANITSRSGSQEEIAFAVGKRERELAVIDQGYDRLLHRKPFLGTPPEEHREILDAWYAHINLLICKLSNVIDPDPKKDSPSKDQLIEMFGVCGGGWQAQLEQMHSNLVVYSDASPKIMVAIAIKKFTEEIIGEIHQDYAKSEHRVLNVHDLNRIRFIVKDYLPYEVLDDHLSDIKWTDKKVRDAFLEKYKVAALVKSFSDAYRVDGSALQEALAIFINTEMFKGFADPYQFKEKLDEIRKEFIELIKEHERDRELAWYQISVSVSTKIPRGEVSAKTPVELLAAFEQMKQSQMEELALEKFNSKYREEATGLITDEGLAEILCKLGFLTGEEKFLGLRQL